MKLVTELPKDVFATPMLAALVAQSFARAVMQVNRVWLRNHPRLPKLYDLYDDPRYAKFRVKYGREPWAGTGLEEFAPIHVCLSRGWGDCDDLAPWRAAEIWEREHRPADIFIYWRPNTQVWHLQVRHWNSHAERKAGIKGRIEDPSRLLGMTFE